MVHIKNSGVTTQLRMLALRKVNVLKQCAKKMEKFFLLPFRVQTTTL